MEPTTFHIQVQYNASVEEVWDALTNKEKMKVWYFDMKNFKPEPDFVFEFYEPGGTKFLHRCKILEVIPRQKLRHTWTHPHFSKGVTVVTWSLSSSAQNQTEVALTHENIESLADGGSDFAKENYAEGWNHILTKSLKTFLEK
ncbi:MAG: SRPBCC domain-containing protein [Chitinophagaceae bacterium]|jgi:uncharacterized protein YndB with AHSA1/START domain|nr:SRPBCC domain-containing protein [Chitinophagaceae bacterium]